MKNILLLETVDPVAMKLLSEAKGIALFDGFSDNAKKKVVSENDIDAIVTRGKGQVNAVLLDECPNLTIIARCGVGLDNIDVTEATKRGIKVINAPNSNAATIAEHTIALILLLQRNLFSAINMVKQGNWQGRNEYKGDEVNGKTLGILGLGNIGKKVATIATALGMKVVYWSAKKENVPYLLVSLDDLLKKSDCISVHLPLTQKTENLLDRFAFERMEKKPMLINTARGKIINQQALLKALNTGMISGFAADVLAIEPPKENDLLIAHPKILITPHLGSLTATTYRQMCLRTVKNVLALLEGNDPDDGCIFNHRELSKN